MKFKRLAGLIVVLICILAVGLVLDAQDQAGPKTDSPKITPWTADDILLAESSGQWEISPDGKWAVWVKSQMDKEKNGGTSNLFLTSLETQK
jgi:hypothetical protein